MEVVTLLLYVGAVWVLGAIGLFAWNLRTSGHEHEDRLALLPLEDNWTDPRAQHGRSSDPRSVVQARGSAREPKKEP